MRRFWFALAAGALLLLPPGRAPAWNAVGHMAVDKLAYDQMDRDLQAAVARLLKAHPHYEAFLSAGRPEGVAEPEWAFLRAGVWPDWVRSKHPDVDPDPTTFHKPLDHYIDTPFVRPADRALFAGGGLDPDADKDNILVALKRHAEVLRGDAKDVDKAVSLCWLLHLVGDIHQPLHCANFYSADFKDKAGDQGGNLFGVSVGGRGYRLHAYWDDLMGQEPAPPPEGRDSPGHQAKVYELVKKAFEELHDPQYRREKLADELAKARFSDWADESYELAKTVVYRNGELAYVIAPKYPMPVPDDAPKLSKDYEEKAAQVGKRRVALAGHRLADKLKELLSRP
jgi:hypothetical protein